MSLGQGQSRNEHAGLIGRFAIAFTLSSGTVFAVAGAMGTAMAQVITKEAQAAVTCLMITAALLLDLHSLRRKKWCPLTVRRQTPQAILYEYGPRRAAVAWGMDTGLIFTTYRMSSISWALLGLALLGVAPWWIGLWYAMGFVVPLSVGCWLGPYWSGDAGPTALAQALAARPSAARATTVLALAITLSVAVTQLTA